MVYCPLSIFSSNVLRILLTNSQRFSSDEDIRPRKWNNNNNNNNNRNSSRNNNKCWLKSTRHVVRDILQKLILILHFHLLEWPKPFFPLRFHPTKTQNTIYTMTAKKSRVSPVKRSYCMFILSLHFSGRVGCSYVLASRAGLTIRQTWQSALGLWKEGAYEGQNNDRKGLHMQKVRKKGPTKVKIMDP